MYHRAADASLWQLEPPRGAQRLAYLSLMMPSGCAGRRCKSFPIFAATDGETLLHGWSLITGPAHAPEVSPIEVAPTKTTYYLNKDGQNQHTCRGAKKGKPGEAKSYARPSPPSTAEEHGCEVEDVVLAVGRVRGS